MIEEFYQLYKSMRDMVEDLRHAELNEHTRQFVDSQESICKNYDKSKSDCYKRWQKEWNSKKENNAHEHD